MQTMTRYKTISAREANEQKAVPITDPYTEDEYDLLDRAIATLGTKSYILVDTREGIVIARPQKEVNLLKSEY
jgi:hypothetical protein